MRSVLVALIATAFSSPASAEECNILWWDLFLPPLAVEFEMTSEVSAALTINDTVKLAPITFELAQQTLTGDDGKSVQLLLGQQTLVSAGLSNNVTVTLQPKTSSWLVGFDSKQNLQSNDGKTYGGKSLLTGWLICDRQKP